MSYYSSYSRLSVIEERLDSIFMRKFKCRATPSKKGLSYKIKEGIMTFEVGFNPVPFCTFCRLSGYINCCDHILYVMNNNLRLNDFIISYLCIPEVYKLFLDMLKVKLDTKKLEDDILDYLSDKICGVCHTDLVDNKFGQHLFFCPTCKNLVHSKCMETWMTKKIKVDGKNQVEKGCIYCKNKNIFV